MLISDGYRWLNEKLHMEDPHYGISGKKFTQYVENLTKVYKTEDILDYGCGKGTLAESLKFPIRQYDPAIPRYSFRPEPADLVICTDVMEHIEPECLTEVLDDLKRLTKKAALITIATRPAVKHLSDGRNAHLIQRGLDFWLPLMWERFHIREMTYLGRKEIVLVLEKLDEAQTSISGNVPAERAKETTEGGVSQVRENGGRGRSHAQQAL